MTITMKPATIKEIRKAMRSLEDWTDTLYLEGICQIKRTGHTGYAYGPTPEEDDSDIYTDYSAWSYCWKEKWILDDIKKNYNIA